MLSRSTILTALTQLSEELGRKGVLGEIDIVGGTAMVLAFNARSSTKDVDAIFEPAAGVRAAAAVVAANMDLPADWLNDSGSALDLPNLRVQAPAAEYMLAMKVLAARTGAGSAQGDAGDIVFLIRLLGLRDAGAVMDIVRRYFDPSRILPRSVYLLDEILEEVNKE
jgi:hypothetical protein